MIDNFDLAKIAILYKIQKHPYYNVDYDVDINIDWLKEYKLCGLAFNHELKAYTFIDLIGDDSIVEIMNQYIDIDKLKSIIL
jgi:hypothetical protein